ncbi:hypothetical protein HYU18_00400 [Candidatus Woesearchaeota archaeon]|nr:hypothetical protein [Candidatus Woesearchaeota archaeon]
MNFSFLIYFFLLLVATAGNAGAAGFGVSPSSLEFSLSEGSEASRQLVIFNTGKDSVDFSILASPSIRVRPESGEIGGGKAAAATVTVIGTKAGVANGELAVSLGSSRNAENRVSLSLGTSVPVTVRVVKGVPAASAFVGILVSVVIVVAGLGVCIPLRQNLLGRAARFI